MNVDDFDPAFQPKLDARKVGDLATLAFVEAKADVALLGPPGGVAHDATAPGLPTGIALTPRTRPAPACPFRAPRRPLRSRQARAFLAVWAGLHTTTVGLVRWSAAGLALAPDDRMLLECRGEVRAATGDPKGALADWRRAVDPDHNIGPSAPAPSCWSAWVAGKGRGPADGQQRGDPGQRHCGYGGKHSGDGRGADTAPTRGTRRHSSRLSICP